MSQQTISAITPYLYYEDGHAALDFLVQALGFEQRHRQVRDDGSLGHAEVTYRDSVVMLGTPQGDSRRDLGPQGCSMMVYVEDVDEHFAAVSRTQAEIVDPPADEPYGRVYCVADPEGRRWYICQSE